MPENESIVRLRGALHAPETVEEKFRNWLAVRAEQDGAHVDDFTDAQRSEMRLQFDENLLAQVLPNDVIAAADLVKDPNEVVRTLRRGSRLAPRQPNAEGVYPKVMIKAKDLTELLKHAGGAGQPIATPEPTPPAFGG